MPKGLIQVYTGDGKGKTTAAIGLMVRAHGSGLKVGLIQFLKGLASGELNSLKALGIPFWQFGRGEFIKSEPSPEDKKLAQMGIEKVEAIWQDFDLLVLDEISYLITFKLVGEEYILDLLRCKPDHLELILTGRDMPPSLIQQADLVTELKKIKHPFDVGITARRGIEY